MNVTKTEFKDRSQLFRGMGILLLMGGVFFGLLAALEFPYFEREILKGIPVQGYHFALLAGIPLAATWVIAVVSKRLFDK